MGKGLDKATHPAALPNPKDAGGKYPTVGASKEYIGPPIGDHDHTPPSVSQGYPDV